MRYIFLLVCLVIHSLCFGQLDCKSILADYKNTIDTTHRPVFLHVDTMPSIATGRNISEFFWENMPQIDSTDCFPIYIYYGFIVEQDSTISNIMFCPTLMFCDTNEDISLIENEYITYLTNKLQQIKTIPGLLNGERVAVYILGRVHFSPQ